MAHPEIATSLDNIALAYKGQGKLIGRVQLYEEGPAMQRIIHGPNTSHPSIATSLTDLARAYLEFGQLQKALVMHEQVWI